MRCWHKGMAEAVGDVFIIWIHRETRDLLFDIGVSGGPRGL